MYYEETERRLENWLQFDTVDSFDQAATSCYLSASGISCHEMRRNLKASPDCHKDPLFEDYKGHCLCKDYPDIGYTCNWVSYYYDYDKSEQGL